MRRLHFAVVIEAPREEVWKTMFAEDTYREWTEPFMPGSHFLGDWSEGSKILFLAPDDQGGMSGMVSRIKESRRPEFISIEHLGTVQEGKEDTESEQVKSWAGALENYTLRDLDGRTELLVEMDTAEEYREMFEAAWPKALRKIKDLAEELGRVARWRDSNRSGDKGRGSLAES